MCESGGWNDDPKYWTWKQISTIQATYDAKWFHIYVFILWYKYKITYGMWRSQLDFTPPFYSGYNGLLFYGCFKMCI